MSDFVAGFASRHQLVGDALTRAFAPQGGFAEVAPGVTPRMPAGFGQAAPRSFSPEAPGPRHFAPADPDRKATEGWDPFASCDAPAADTDAFADVIAQARDAGFAEGMAAAAAQNATNAMRDQQLLARIADAVSAGSHIDRDALALRLRQTVLALVTRLVGELGVSADHLAGRIDAAAHLLADGAESALLRMHPDDVPLVEGKLPQTLFPAGDATLERGGFVLETATTIIEDSPALWLDQLAEVIEAVALPC